MNQVRKIFSIGMLIISVVSILGSCLGSAQLAQVQGAQATFNGLKQVVMGAPNTLVMTDSAGWYLLAWPQAGKWGWTIIGPQGVDLNALKIDATDMAKTVNDLLANGWKYITAKELPQRVLSACTLYSMSTATFGMTTLPTLLVFPGFMMKFVLPQEGPEA